MNERFKELIEEVTDVYFAKRRAEAEATWERVYSNMEEILSLKYRKEIRKKM